MRKSNVLIATILVLASVFFLALWYYLRFNLIDNPLDLVATIVWWVVIAVGCFLIHRAEKKRQEKIRTAYIADAMLFNPEAGMVSTSSKGAVSTLSQVISNLSYNFDLQDLDDYSVDPNFKYVVFTSKFADNGDTWEGRVALMADPNAEPIVFSNRDELAQAIS